MKRYLDQGVPSLFLASSFRMCLNLGLGLAASGRGRDKRGRRRSAAVYDSQLSWQNEATWGSTALELRSLPHAYERQERSQNIVLYFNVEQ